jgi:hypothetical protein
MSEVTGTLNFPNVSGSNLEGKKFNLPKDFEEKLNIVVIAFRREQTALIEAWTGNLEEIEQKNLGVKFYELPVLSKSYSPFRWWIDGGMRAGIVDSKTRKRTITVYTTKNAFKNQLRIPNEETIYIFLVNKSGKILWRTKGDFTEEKNQQLRHALQENK